MKIDLPLLKLRYEILNVSLADLAEEIATPLSILEKEATLKNWAQWWPDSLPGVLTTPSPILPSDSPTDPSYINDEEDYSDQLTPLEEGAQTYVKESRIRLQVYTLAKEIYLAHKYATLESDLIDQARIIVEVATTPQDLAQLSSVFKNLGSLLTSAAKSHGQSALAIGQNEDGVPTVIIRDLTGKRD